MNLRKFSEELVKSLLENNIIVKIITENPKLNKQFFQKLEKSYDIKWMNTAHYSVSNNPLSIKICSNIIKHLQISKGN